MATSTDKADQAPDPEPGKVEQPTEAHKPGKAKKKAKAKHNWSRTLILAVIPVAVGALIPIIFVYVQHRANPPVPHIEVDSITVTDANINTGGSAKIHIVLRNTGNQLAVIRDVSFRVEQSRSIPLCVGQGGPLFPSAYYGATMPVQPRSGSVVNAPVSQQEGPDTADQFVVGLHLPKSGAMYGSAYLYHVHIFLLYDNVATPIDAGDAVVSLPGDPNGDYVWMKNSTKEFANPASDKIFGTSYPEWSRCLIKNAQAVRRMLALPGSRSVTLGDLRSTLSYCCVVKVPPGSQGSSSGG